MTAYSYDAAGRLTSQTDGFAGGVGSTQSTFTYNPAGQLRSESRTNDAYAWRGSEAVNRNYATNGQNQYTGTVSNGAPSATFTHDANGNLTSSVNPPYSTSYAYDSENRLVSASGSENATLTYDPLGRLFQIHSADTGLTQFLYDGDELVAEYIGWGNLARRYIHGDSNDDPLYWYEGAGLDQPRFPHVNHQGSVIATAGAGAALLSINTYDEYGIPGANQRGVTALGTHGRFQYTGQAWIPELGLYYYKARFYSPPLGRFLQVDPIGYDDQVSLYAYVGNDPVSKIDPSGKATTLVTFYTDLRFVKLGNHSGIHLSNTSEGQAIYDPGGSYTAKDEYGGPAGGSGDLFTGRAGELGPYIKSGTSVGNYVRLTTLNTTQAEEDSLLNSMDTAGGRSGGLCAVACSSILGEVPALKSVPSGLLPDSVADSVAKNPRVVSDVMVRPDGSRYTIPRPAPPSPRSQVQPCLQSLPGKLECR